MSENESSVGKHLSNAERKRLTDLERRKEVDGVVKEFSEQQRRFLSMSEIGQMLGLSQSQVVRAKRDGKLPAARRYVSSAEEVMAFAHKYVTKDDKGKPRVSLYPATEDK